MEKNNSLQGKKVIILGGSSGLGLATARAAAAEGAIITIVSGNQSRINEALAQLPENSTGTAVDLNSDENIRTFFAAVRPFDHLVYTAGENLNLNMIADTDLQQSRSFFNLRYWGALAAIKYATPSINPGG